MQFPTTKKLLTINFLSGLYFYVPIFALYFADFGVSISAVVFSQVLYSVFSFFGEVPTGLLADHYGQKKSLIAGHFLEAFGILLLLLYPSAIGLYISYGLRGLAGSFMSGSDEALLYESAKVEGLNYKKLASNYHSINLFGSTFATAVAGVILRYMGTSSYELLIWITFICSSLAFLLVFFIEQYGNIHEDIATPKELLMQTYKLFNSNDIIRTLMWVSLLTLSGKYFLQAVYPLQFESVGLEPLWTGFALSIAGVLNIFATKYMYLLEKYLTYEKILLLVHGLMIGGYFMVGYGSAYIVLIGFIFTGMLFDSHKSITSDYINQEVDSSIRSTTLSSLSFIRTGGQIIARLVLGGLLGFMSVSNTLGIQGLYLTIGIAISYRLLVRCGCVNKILQHEE